MPQIDAPLRGDGIRCAIIASRFNEFITRSLVDGALDTLRRLGAPEPDVIWVPGAFEIPLVAKQAATTGRYDAVITLGAVIRGATAHFDYVAGNAASGVARAALDTGIPVIFGILTTDTIEQAIERAGTKAGNKGAEAALAAIEMAQIARALATPSS